MSAATTQGAAARPALLPWAVGLSLAGLVMGLLTSLVGLPTAVELPLWMAWYVVWGVAVIRRGLPPFVTPLVASLLSGVWTGAAQAALWSQYVANNPWYADQFKPGPAPVAEIVGFALAMGAAWGLLVGGVCWGVARWRNKRAG